MSLVSWAFWTRRPSDCPPPPALTLLTGAEILFRSGDDPERLRGPNLSGAWLDEASQMPKDAFDILIGCLRQEGQQGFLTATMTPRGLGHWTYEKWGKAAPDTAIFQAQTRDNPFNPPGFHQQLARQYGGLRAAQELEGQFVNIEGAEWAASYFPESLWFSEWPREFALSALALDPSMGKGERSKSCYAAFVFAGLDRRGVLWVEAWLSQSWDAAQLVQQAVTLCRRHQPRAFSVETNGGQAFLLPLLAEAGRKESLPLPLYSIHNREDKEAHPRGRRAVSGSWGIPVQRHPGDAEIGSTSSGFPRRRVEGWTGRAGDVYPDGPAPARAARRAGAAGAGEGVTMRERVAPSVPPVTTAELADLAAWFKPIEPAPAERCRAAGGALESTLIALVRILLASPDADGIVSSCAGSVRQLQRRTRLKQFFAR